MSPMKQPENSPRKLLSLVLLLLAMLLALSGVIVFGLPRNRPAAENLPPALRESAASPQSNNIAPGEAYILSGTAVGLAQQGKLVEAAESFANVVRSNPDDAEAQYKLAHALEDVADISRDLGKYEEAKAHYLEAVRLNPRDTLAQKGLALILGKLGKTAEAEGMFSELVVSRPDDAQVHYYLGLSRVILGRREEAVDSFRTAGHLDPGWALPFNDLAWILATHPKAEVRNGAEAVLLAERACRLTGGSDPSFFGTLDAAYAEAGRFNDAIKTAQITAKFATDIGKKDLAEAARQREKLYREKKPYRQP
jgi:tetratricopeptide (TPR) repeat protein